ncbi:hypothetical protein L3Y34_014002 [Caenorhabditis briggsae]|uniref:Uncharacterized protein n=1 Tax=Caenorhabditis briggsae TaxID=6238 RepID=A0AAE9DQE4_CAEBR|nr:hypothetical protein L3Y34_014002 [Caenorhabditis briggsae]
MNPEELIDEDAFAGGKMNVIRSPQEADMMKRRSHLFLLRPKKDPETDQTSSSFWRSQPAGEESWSLDQVRLCGLLITQKSSSGSTSSRGFAEHVDGQERESYEKETKSSTSIKASFQFHSLLLE